MTGRNTAAATAAAKSLQSCPTLCDPIDGSLLRGFNKCSAKDKRLISALCENGVRYAKIYWMLTMILSGEGNGTPLQYSCLENPMDGGAW